MIQAKILKSSPTFYEDQFTLAEFYLDETAPSGLVTFICLRDIFEFMNSQLLAVLAIITANFVCLAQTNPPAQTDPLGSDAKPASSNAAGQQYPKVDSHQRAEFRLQAPTAQRVQVDIGGHKYDMTKDDK